METFQKAQLSEMLVLDFQARQLKLLNVAISPSHVCPARYTLFAIMNEAGCAYLIR